VSRASRHRRYAIACLLLAASSVAALAQTAPPFIAEPALIITLEGTTPMRLPTAVAVGPDGTIFVCDGVADRVLCFSPAGDLLSEIRDVGGKALSRPTGVKVDAAGLLWIADTGHGRAVARGPDGRLVHELSWPSDAAAPADVTDVAISPDGTVAWLVDNDAHRIARFDIAAGTARLIGEPGQSLGQFYYPFMLATGPAGDLFVSESLNGRVQILAAGGRIRGRLGAFGADPGQLFRPKGLAVDANGNIWVADGIFGVIQIFQPTGVLLDILRDTAGNPLKLETPCGITLDGAGHLYVAEPWANRVRQFNLTVDPRPIPPWPSRPSTSPLTAQPRACAVCHLEWVEPLAHGVATPLASVPPDTAAEPIASDPRMCLSCHDGSVRDSRRRVWAMAGHHVGVPPPADVPVPRDLPLAHGLLACRTCHTAHALSEPTAAGESIIFLRVRETAGELCTGCHAQQMAGPAAGMHKLGDMPGDIPASLLAAGGRPGRSPTELACLTCHATHGVTGETALVVPSHSPAMCADCHELQQPQLFGSGNTAGHPPHPTLAAHQIEVMQQVGGVLGPQNTLDCATCHQPHAGDGATHLLAAHLKVDTICRECHEPQRAVEGSLHDIPPDNSATHNACRTCHNYHTDARTPQPTELDPAGHCLSCHQPGQPGAARVLGSPNHPEVACAGCHDPHESQHGHFLSAPAGQLCSSCHEEEARVAGGTHDCLTDSSQWPSEAANTHDTCLACHRAHGNEQTGLYRLAAADSTGSSGVCLSCHPSAVPGGREALALAHPLPAASVAAEMSLPLDGVGPDRQIACRTCHDPHAGPGSTTMLRTQVPGGAGEQVCFACHEETANIHSIGHAAGSLRDAGFASESCQPCHVTHAAADAIDPQLLWPKALAEYAGMPDVAVADQPCVACHRVGGPVTPPTIATHPEAEMLNLESPTSPGYLPLFNERGEVDPQGHIACRTCHLTHGRSMPAVLPAEVRNVAGRELRARSWHVRSFGPGNVCTTCHGPDALRRFMYFHNPARRGGPIEGGAPPVLAP
jgi:predicted CXXCH cytochrome family protein